MRFESDRHRNNGIPHGGIPLFGKGVRLRCPVMSLARTPASMVDRGHSLWALCPFGVPDIFLVDKSTASDIDPGTHLCSALSATGSAEQRGRHRQRAGSWPDSHLRFESDRHRNNGIHQGGIPLFGAGDRTRTGTLSPAVDFESTTATNAITPAGSCTVYTIFRKIASIN